MGPRSKWMHIRLLTIRLCRFRIVIVSSHRSMHSSLCLLSGQIVPAGGEGGSGGGRDVCNNGPASTLCEHMHEPCTMIGPSSLGTGAGLRACSDCSNIYTWIVAFRLDIVPLRTLGILRFHA